MAKASLNMLTRTSARDYVRDGIRVESVNTGKPVWGRFLKDYRDAPW